VVLAISSGGIRAAALGYGVLEELHRTEVMVNGVKLPLIDEVDVISAVSGRAFPATYYALRGEKTFKEFETRVLSRNLESELARRIILNPANWFRLASGTFGNRISSPRSMTRRFLIMRPFVTCRGKTGPS
jgi:NTE family protein